MMVAFIEDTLVRNAHVLPWTSNFDDTHTIPFPIDEATRPRGSLQQWRWFLQNKNAAFRFLLNFFSTRNDVNSLLRLRNRGRM